ncbi:hypothetical protein L7F22_007285 [Adiantum nelumboides]|nr:hypothetical protein [Adiantum nelumboides]
MAPPTVSLSFPHGGKSSFSGGLFINNEFVAAGDGKTFAVVNPSDGKEIAQVAEASAKDVDVAVKAARKAFNESWGLNVPGFKRGQLLIKLAELIEANLEEIAAIESLDNGKAFSIAKGFDITEVAANIRYYAGWADKNHGKVIEVDSSKLHIQRQEPMGVCGQIIPWNFPAFVSFLSASFFRIHLLTCPSLQSHVCLEDRTGPRHGQHHRPQDGRADAPVGSQDVRVIKEAGFPPGVVNVISGFGPVAGAAIANHMDIDKVAFTGSTLVGRNILKAAASSNLKKVTLELGGKSPNIIFADADLDQAISWSAFGIMFNHGQCCCAGSRVYVEESIYEKFMAKFDEKIKSIQVGNPFEGNTFQGPRSRSSSTTGSWPTSTRARRRAPRPHGRHSPRSGRLLHRAHRLHRRQPRLQNWPRGDLRPRRCCAQVQGQRRPHQEGQRLCYGLAAAVFSRDVTRALDTANKLQAGTVWVNCYNRMCPFLWSRDNR